MLLNLILLLIYFTLMLCTFFVRFILSKLWQFSDETVNFVNNTFVYNIR